MQHRDDKTFEILIPIITILIGFIPHMLFSLSLNAFWIGSPVDYPFLAIPTVFFGDLVFLPLFNYFAYRALKFSWIQIEQNHTNKKLGSIISIMISLILSIYIHYTWFSDSYTGFMDVVLGKPSIAGWWHFGFTVIQMSVVLFFVWCWFTVIHKRNTNESNKLYLKGWWVFLAFTLLNIPDYAFRWLFVYKDEDILGSLRNQLSSFSTAFFSILILIVTQVLVRRDRRTASR
jgi:uncharacterized membrane protein (DUF485 family)